MRILIVDDNRDLVSSMTRLLQLMGHEVESAFDGRSGVEAALRYRPRVILLDIGLPRLDGYEVARTLRGNGLGDVLMIAISGYGQLSDRRRSREAGIDHHMTKPVDLRALLALFPKEEEAVKEEDTGGVLKSDASRPASSDDPKSS